jgi:hypothetical protein
MSDSQKAGQNTAPKVTLEEVMNKLSGAVEESGPVVNDSNDSSEPVDAIDLQPEDSVSPSRLPDDIENNPVFKNLPNDQKDKVRQEGFFDPDADLFNAAVVDQRQEMLDTINRVRDSKNQPPMTMEEFVTSNGNTPKTEEVSDDETLQTFKREMARIAGDDVEDENLDETEEDARIKQLKGFERQLADAVPVEFEIPVDPESKSAAIDFTIDYNTEYVENLKGILDDNDIKFKTKKKGGLKKGLLKNFIQRNPHVTTPLVNSGFYVTLSGASIPEIIQMNTMTARKRSEAEMKKIAFIKKHLVETSVGKNLSLSQLSQIVYHKDIQTLYFNLFIGSFPKLNEFPVTCENEKCATEMRLQIHAADLVLNIDEFQDTINYILYKNTDIKDVIDQTSLSKEKRVKLTNKMSIGFRNPSVWDVIFLSDRLEELQKEKDISAYSRVAGYLMYINYIALPEDGEYVKFDDLMEMLEILNALDETALDEIDAAVEEYTNKNVVKYGLKQYKCPKCNRIHKERELDMSDFLFTLSQSNWAVREVNKMKKKEELQKNESK